MENARGRGAIVIEADRTDDAMKILHDDPGLQRRVTHLDLASKHR